MALCPGGKLRSVGVHGEEGTFGYVFYCPGCEDSHHVTVRASRFPGPIWGFNGNEASPTFTPSLLVRGWRAAREGEAMMDRGDPLPPGMDRYPGANYICHSFVVDGKIQFLGDCTHSKANQTVDIPQWPGSEE